MQSRSTGTRGTGTTSGQTPSNHRHLDINIQSVPGRRDTGATTGYVPLPPQQGTRKMETSVLQRFLIPDRSPGVNQASNNQPRFTDGTDDRFVITRESDILYTLGVIEKRLLSMHCGLPWWRGVISGGIRSSTYSNTVCSTTHACHTRIEAVHGVLPVYETQYTCRFRFCALSAGNNLHAAPNQPTMKEGRTPGMA